MCKLSNIIAWEGCVRPRCGVLSLLSFAISLSAKFLLVLVGVGYLFLHLHSGEEGLYQISEHVSFILSIYGLYHWERSLTGA